jgi:hypothetical protein
MMATVSIKNLVGCTVSSTFNEAQYLERIAHRREPPESNYFNNDIFWRAILDMNKIILYADKDGILQPTQQRMYLSVVDGIQAMERAHAGGIPYDRHVILAGVDPVSVDAVSCRIMGYDYSVIPSIGNADSDTVHPIGTNDPENIVIVGEEIDSEFDHVFTFNSAWEGDAGTLAITDFVPPTINSINRQANTVTANVSDGLVSYIQYQVDGAEQVEKMSKDGDIYSGTVPDTVSEYWILAQDEYFNTAQSAGDSITILNGPSSCAFGILDEDTSYPTGLTYFTVTNNSAYPVNITIGSSDMTGGVTWTLSDAATSGPDTYGLKAGLAGGSYNVTVRKNSPYNTLISNLTSQDSQSWGIELLSPTSFSDDVQKSGTIILTATQA